VINEPHLFEQNAIELPDLGSSNRNTSRNKKSAKEAELIKRTSQILDEVMNAKSKLDIEKDKLFPTLYELFLYADKNLKTKALELINELYSQNDSLGKTLFDIQIIDDKVSMIKYEKAMDSSFILNTIGDIMEKWYEEPEAVELGHLVILLNMLYKNLICHGKNLDLTTDPKTKELEKIVLNTDVIKNKAKLQRLGIKVDPIVLNIDTPKQMDDLHQYSIDAEEEELDLFEQDLYRNTRVYEGLIKILKFDAEMGTSETQMEDKTQINLLIKKIYRIMAKACKENYKNKILMAEHLDEVILYHFNACQESGYDNNSYFLLNELVIDNKAIILSEKHVKNITEKVCNTI